MKPDSEVRKELEKEVARLRERLRELEKLDSQRNLAEKALWESEERYRSFVQDFQGIAFRGSFDWKPIFFHGAVEKITGHEPDEFTDGDLTWSMLIDPDDLAAIEATSHDIRSTPNFSLEREYRIRRKDGHIRWVHEVIHNISDEDGVPFQVQGAIYDITERKKTEKILRESEEMYKTLVQTSPEAVTVTDIEGNITYVSPNTLELHGFDSQDELLGKNAFILIAPEEHERAAENLKNTLTEGTVRNIVYTLLRKDGSRFIGELNATLIRDIQGNPKGFIATLRDITKRKEEERLLQESEEKYRTLVEQSHQGLVILQGENIVFMNNTFAETLGYSVDEMLKWSQEEMFGKLHPEDRLKVSRRLRDRMQGKTVPERYELRAFRSDGEQLWIEISSSVIEYRGKPAIQATLLDITERRRAEAALRESEEKFRMLAEKSPNMIFINKGGRIVYVNEKCVDVIGYAKEEFYSPEFNFLTIIAPEHLDLVKSSFKLHSQGKDIDPYEYSLVNKDGKRLETIISTKLINYDGEQAILGIITDITERKLLEEQLHHSQKLEAIGMMAGGIAHDFNNLLIAIMGYSDLVLTSLGDDNPLSKDVLEIRRAADKAASLTKQLLVLGRKQVLQKRVINLNSVISNMQEMIGRLIGVNANLEVDLEPSLHFVEIDPSQFELVVINLVINARDAMPDGGLLSIRTENRNPDERACETIPCDRRGEFVCLTVSDNGTGMDKETLEHIYEPFFSTKGTGQGTGLGLATVHSSVKQHNGCIHVESAPGKGTTFEIYFPASPETPDENYEKDVSIKELEGNGERILLIEDEERVRVFSARMLSEHGYVVTEAMNAEEGIEIFNREGGNFHLVFSDVVLPGKTGLKLAEELKKGSPDLKILLSSGYTEQQSRLALAKEKNFRFIQKPYSRIELLRIIKEMVQAD